MATLSQTKYFNLLHRKKKNSPLESYTFNPKGEMLVSSIVDNFLFIRNQTTFEYKKLFPVNELRYLDFELLEDGSYLFVIVDYNGLTFQIRNFERGTLKTYSVNVDSYCKPSIILKGDVKGIYYSRNSGVYRKPYLDGDLLEEELIVQLKGEYLEYAVYDDINSCVKLVTKVFDTSVISPAIFESEVKVKEFVRFPVTLTLEKKDV